MTFNSSPALIGSLPDSGPQDATAFPVRSVGSRLLRTLALIAAAFATPTALVGFATDDPMQLALSAALLGAAIVLADAARANRGALTPITLYAFSWTLTSAANLIGILNQDTASRPSYFLYAVEEHLPLAMKLSWLGLAIPVLAFKWFAASPGWRSIAHLLPSVEGEIADRYLLPAGLAAAAFGIFISIAPFLPSLGTLSALLGFLPHLVAFVLARMGASRGRRSWIWMALLIAVAEASRAALFAYLRGEVLSPIFAYSAGVLIGARSLRALRSPYLWPVYLFAIVFVAYFAAFGEVRSRSSLGVGRLNVVNEARLAQEHEGQQSHRTLLARLSNFNQLTQVVRVAEEDGPYQGKTLEYLAYAWIPRFVWPEKPLIAKGSWFAYRIGQARLFNGRITNSVNMTIPGELYLNFGWLGAFLGLLGYGVLLAALWLTTRFWSRPSNVLGAAFGFYLIWTGMIAGADLQIAVTLIATYLVFAAVSLALGSSGTIARDPRRAIRPHESPVADAR
jgi:hypothetical protein